MVKREEVSAAAGCRPSQHEEFEATGRRQRAFAVGLGFSPKRHTLDRCPVVLLGQAWPLSAATSRLSSLMVLYFAW
jgi:hypothetical protein